MRAARAWGTTYAQFHGQATVATHYDQEGNVTGTTLTESPWTAEQRAYAIGLLEYQDGCCPGCGGHLDETTTPEAEYAYRDDGPVRCHKCVALARAKAKWKDEPEGSTDGLLFSVHHR